MFKGLSQATLYAAHTEYHHPMVVHQMSGVERATTDRYRQEDDDYVPYTGYFREYEERRGIVIPTEAEVKWTLSDEDLSYWRASIDEIEYQTGYSLPQA